MGEDPALDQVVGVGHPVLAAPLDVFEADGDPAHQLPRGGDQDAGDGRDPVVGDQERPLEERAGRRTIGNMTFR